jgi:hypothetical protein
VSQGDREGRPYYEIALQDGLRRSMVGATLAVALAPVALAPVALAPVAPVPSHYCYFGVIRSVPAAFSSTIPRSKSMG